MKIERPNALEDLKDLEKLKTLIEQATVDGLLSKDEMETIKVLVRADQQITPQELELCQQLIWDKITTGKLIYNWTEL